MTGLRKSLTYVVNALNPGGTERLVVEMSRAFATRYSVSVVCLDEPGSWAADLRSQGIPVYCLWRQPGLDVAVAGRLAALFRYLHTDLIHANQCTPWFYSALSRLRYRKPRLLLEEHGRFFPETENRSRMAFNRLLISRLTHRFVAVSADIRERLVRYEGLPAAQIEVIYNGVAPQPLVTQQERQLIRAELGFGSADFVVGTVGRFDPIKNLPLLAQGLARASVVHPEVRGLLVGDGPCFSEIAALIAREGLQERVRLTGFRQDARRLLQCCDLFVLASLSEGTSMALLEAMEGGVPAVVTNVGGNPEIVLDGSTGWVVRSGSLDEMSNAIQQAASLPERRMALAEAGRQRFVTQFTLERMLASYQRLYDSMLGVPRVPGSPMTAEKG